MLRLVLGLLLVAPSAFAAIGVYEFDDPAQEQRFRALTDELRCPKCQNQNIADSNAPLAADLRQRVYTMVREGQSDADILAFMVARYGDFITYRPPLKPTTWVLWFGPFVILGLVALALAIWIRRHRPSAELGEQDRQRLQSLLGDSDEDRG